MLSFLHDFSEPFMNCAAFPRYPHLHLALSQSVSWAWGSGSGGYSLGSTIQALRGFVHTP